MKGTLINAATVTAGSLIGLLIGSALPPNAQEIALGGIGLVNLGFGVKLFLQSKNMLIIAVAISLGGIIGLLLGIQPAMDHLADWVRKSIGGGGTFTEGLVTSTLLFCVGPMTLLGCIQDGIEGKSEILLLKSTLDGIASIFLAATLGVGVVCSVVTVLLIQGAITLLAKPLSPLREDAGMLDEISGTGGPIILAIGLSLLSIKKLPIADFLPALALTPLLVNLDRRFSAKKVQ